MPRRKNPNIKQAGEQLEFNQNQIIELKRCASDPIYFITNYIYIQHPTKGLVLFDPYDFQLDLIREYVDNRFVIVLSPRQSGKTTTTAAFFLWYSCFNFDKTILIASNKESNAKEIIHRMRIMYENLPMWIKPGVEDDGWNKHSLSFDNKCRVISTATSENAGRGLSISLLFLDEFAFVAPNIQDEFWTAMEPTLSTGGDCIITSTPNGDSNLFASMWRAANHGTNGFKPIQVKWNAVPGRDLKFKQDTIRRVGQKKWDQEYDCKFISSDMLLIDSVILSDLSTRLERENIEVKETNGFRFFKEIERERTYIVGMDPSTGSGNDFTVISVFEFPSMEQVAMYRSNETSSGDAYIKLKQMLKWLDQNHCTAYFSVENNGVGEGIITLYQTDENPPDTAFFVSEKGKNRKGMTTTAKSKKKACMAFKDMVEKEKLKINCNITMSEIKNYVRKGGTYQAQAGSTDDCISSILVVLRILEDMATYEQDAYDTLYSLDADFVEYEDIFGDSDGVSFGEFVV